MGEKEAYFAGLLDGDGSVVLAKKGEKYTQPTFALNVIISNKHRGVLEEAQRLFGGSIQPSGEPRNDGVYGLYLAARDAMRFLEAVLPYLRIKKEQARVAIEFQRGMRRWGSKGPERRTPEEIQRQLLCRATLQSLNRRGTNVALL